MRLLNWIVVIGTLVPAGVAAQEPPRGGPPEATQERRAELEREVRRRFLAQVSRRLDLDEAQRERLTEVIRSGAGARLELAREGRQLRRELVEAVRSDSAPAATYEGILRRLDALQERERALEEREEGQLAEFLDARQRAVFLVMRMQLNDRIRRAQQAPSGRRGGRPGR